MLLNKGGDMMKKKNIFWEIFILCIIILIAPMQSSTKIDPANIFFDEKGDLYDSRISALDLQFLEIRVDIIMANPNFPGINFNYDKIGIWGESYEKYVSLQTRGKIVIHVRDTREFYSSLTTKSEFLEYFYGLTLSLEFSLFGITNDFNNDVVIYLIPKEGLEKDGLLGYFYKGEYVILKDLP